MTVNLYMTWETPYLPAVAGLTVEAWPASYFTHSPVGNPSAYPPAPSPTATTTTDSSGNCELTGLTAGTDYYISIIDQNNQPWFQFCPQGYLGNLSTSRRRWSINQGPQAPVTSISAHGELVFAGYINTSLSVGGNVAMPLANVLYDPLSGSDGFGYKTPASLAGLNLYAECSLTFGGATGAGSGYAADLNVALRQNAALLNATWFDVPLGGINIDRTIALAGVAVGVATDDLIQVYTGTNANGSLAWGALSHFYTSMRVFAC